MKTLTLIFALLSLSSGSVSAQGSMGSTAIMRVQVEIVGGVQFDQMIVEAGASEISRMDQGEHISLGEYSITVPEGADFSIHTDQEIEMHGTGSWSLETATEMTSNGRTQTFQVKCRTATGGETIEHQGAYEGRQVAVLEFH
ncbi:MAG: hypothetical protein WEA36_09445 [Balneolaceae bacterium]